MALQANDTRRLHRLPILSNAIIVPTALGGAVFLLLIALIDSRVIESTLCDRYLVGHPIARITTCLFCIGMVHLFANWRSQRKQSRGVDAIQLNHLRIQNAKTNQPVLDLDDVHEHDDVTLAKKYLQGLSATPNATHGHLLFRRLVSILNFIRRNQATSAVEAELKYQSEVDADEQYQSNAFVRILIWATPMLGFLGTVIGISQALGQLNVGPDNDLQGMMAGLQSNLYVAFDTTAQALVLSIVMMFGMFFLEREQKQLLQTVDAEAMEQIESIFEFSKEESNVENLTATKAVNHVGRKMLAATRAAVGEHTRIWRKTIESAEHAWVTANRDVAERSQVEITSALKAALSDLSQGLDQSIRNADESMSTRWGQWQTMLSENSRSLDKLQEHNQTQVKMLADAIEQLTKMAEKQSALPLDEGLAEIVSAVRLLKEEILSIRETTLKESAQFQLKIAQQSRRAA